MNRLGILIDISHASDVAQLQIIEASAAPVAASHHGIRHFSSVPRNLSDEVLKALAAKRGLIGIHSQAGFLSQKFDDWSRSRAPAPGAAPARPQPLVLSPLQDYGKYITALDTQVGNGWRRNFSRPWRERQAEVTDAGGPLPTVDDWANQVDYAVKLVGDDYVGIGLDMQGGGANFRDFDATSYPRLTEALLAKGYSRTRIGKILGENWLRLLDSAKVTASETPTRH
jgi:membrane dipeptidase